jgi:4'-phosphopantetheinyl transferase
MVMPVLETEGVVVLAFTLAVGPDHIRQMGACLSDDERRRAASLVWARDRRRFIVTRGRLRHLLASRIGVPASRVELAYGPQGKPCLSRRMALRDLRFSVSRSEDLAVIALSDAGEIGVDIEAVRPVPEADDIAATCFSARELEGYRALPAEERAEGFLRRWTQLEAVSKALGCGLGQPLPPDHQDWNVHAFVPTPGYTGAVVVQN